MNASERLLALISALDDIADISSNDLTEAVQAVKDWLPTIAEEVAERYVPTSSGTRTILDNGEHIDISGVAQLNVRVPLKLKWKAENGVLELEQATK